MVSPMEDLVVIGRIARAHGNKGQVIVNPETDFAEDRFKVGAVVLLGPTAEPRVIKASRFQQRRPVVWLEGVETMTEAEALAGMELRVAAGADLLPEATYYHYDLVGCEVRDRDGAVIGSVTAVEGTMERSRLVVAGPRAEVLIPLVAHICVVVDVGARRIVVELPDGLVELNERRARE